MKVKINLEAINTETLEGWVLLDIPPHDERMELLGALNFKVEGDQVVQGADTLVSCAAMCKIAREKISEVEITYKPTGQKISKEEFFVYEDFQAALLEAAGICIRGLTLGKKL